MIEKNNDFTVIEDLPEYLRGKYFVPDLSNDYDDDDTPWYDDDDVEDVDDYDDFD